MVRLSKIIILAVVAAVSFGTARTTSAEPWPIKSFEVVPVNIALFNPTDIRLFLESLPPILTEEGKARLIDLAYPEDSPMGYAKELVPQIEEVLTKAAEYFEQAGFPAPALKPEVEKDDVPAYRVFLVRGLGNAGEYHQDPCDLRIVDKEVVLLDYDAIRILGDLKLEGKQTVAHELFHAVQHKMPFFQGCDTGSVGDWITEGTARAMGWAAIKDEWPQGKGEYSAVLWETIWGLRDYESPLPRPADPSPVPDLVAYATSSFWTYLGEYYAMSGHPSTPGVNPIRMDYLAQMFRASPATRDCASPGAPCKGEVKWLDEQTRAVLGKPLRDIFARFAQAYALYGSWRLQGVALHDPMWLTGAFDKSTCSGFLLRPGGKNLQEVIDLDPFLPWSMRCWEVRPTGFKGDTIRVAVTVEMPSGAQTPPLVQLTSVIADGSRRMKKAKLDSAPGERQGVRWEYDFVITDEDPTSQGNLFLLTNVADAAELTETFVGKNNTGLRITFTALQEYASMGDSNVGGAELAEAIDTPFEIEFDNYRAVVQIGQAEKVGDQYVGRVFSEGLINPCMLQINARGDIQPGRHFAQMFGIMLQTSGPIAPGEYSIAPFRELNDTHADDFPNREAVAGALLYDMPENQNDLQWEAGTLVIDLITPELVAGQIQGVAHHRELSDQTGNYEITETRTLAAKFSIKVRGVLGKYRDMGYPCIGRAEGK